MERPILFSTPMVRAILEGRKTQTRRMNGLEKIDESQSFINDYVYKGFHDKLNIHVFARMWKGSWVQTFHCKCPYGKPGDILWVRETWFRNDINSALFFGSAYTYKADVKDEKLFKWKPSIFMPKEACRIRLEVEDIRVQRLQDISEEDAIAEGIKKIDGEVIGYPFGIPFNYSNGIGNYTTPKEAYSALWESINGKGSWDNNPWVWVIDFKKL